MSFDRVAEIYDVTRGVPAEATARRTERIIAATRAGPQTRFLELGIGTGRVALPFIEGGYPYTGIDISPRMMDRLRAKLPSGAPNLTLLESDISELPFPDDSFDVVLSFKVLHLVPQWRKALDEAQRVLRPGGYIVLGDDTYVEGEPPQDVRDQWRAFVLEAGAAPRPRHGSWDDALAVLTEQEWRTTLYQVARTTFEFRPLDLIEAQRSRTYSESWDIPEEALESAYRRMLQWSTERYGDPGRPMTVHGESAISVSWKP